MVDYAKSLVRGGSSSEREKTLRERNGVAERIGRVLLALQDLRLGLDKRNKK
jgi:hypothetical protein